MQVLWVLVLLTCLTIAVEAKNGWQKGKGSWHKHKGGEDGYHKNPDGNQGNSNGNGGNGQGNGQGTNGNGSNGQGTNGNGGNGQGTNGNGGNGQGNGQGTNGNGGNGQDTNGNGNNGQGNEQGTNGNNNGKDPRPTPSRTVSDVPEEAFHDLARQVIADDNIVAKYCEKNRVKGATELYGPDYYQLIIPIQDDDADYIEVKIKHRVIYIKAETPDIDQRWSADDDHHIHYIKLLPNFLDITRIRWDIKNLKLIVTIPYKFKFNKEQPIVCDKQKDVNAKEIVVPRGGISREPVDPTTIFPKPQKDEEVTTIDPNILDHIFGRR